MTVEVLEELSEEIELEFGGSSILVLHGVRGAENAVILGLNSGRREETRCATGTMWKVLE